MTKKFEGKVAVITGGSKGIGKEIARQFASQGAQTVIVARGAELGQQVADELTETYGVQCLFVQADIAELDQMENVRNRTIETFGRVDYLILNAAIGYKLRTDEISMEEWNKIIRINLTGTFVSVKAFYQDFLTNQGAIVYISSGSTFSGTGGGSAYCAAKAGGEGMMRVLAKELGPKGVNVNTVAPRVVITEMYHPEGKELEGIVSQIPMGRPGTAKDIANMAIFLCDPENSYISGQTFLLDGGRTIR